MRSIDPVRRRIAPRTISGRDRVGRYVEFHLTTTTLLLIVKANCVACDDLLAEGPAGFEGFDVYYLAADESASSHHFDGDVIFSSKALDDFEVRWPPAYLVIDPVAGYVIGEGVIFDAAQVRHEIEAYRTP